MKEHFSIGMCDVCKKHEAVNYVMTMVSPDEDEVIVFMKEERIMKSMEEVGYRRQPLPICKRCLDEFKQIYDKAKEMQCLEL